MGKLADLAFPGIVDVVEQEEERFLIMEWIEGETLAAQMERDGAFAEETVIEIGICLAKAIQKLHQMQPPLLYLDCKPSNVMKDTVCAFVRGRPFQTALCIRVPEKPLSAGWR